MGLWKHNKIKHINVDNTNNTLSNIDNTLHNTTKEVEKNLIKQSYNCNYCNRLFNHFQNRWKHEKICKNKINIKNNKLTELEIKKIELEKINAESNKIKEEKEKINAEKELIKLKIKLQSGSRLDSRTFKTMNKMLMAKSYNKNINSNNTTNNIQNIQNINNISLVGSGKEELLEILTKKEKRQIMNSGFLCLEKIIEISNLGNYNKFKNIIITNLKDNFAHQYDEKLGYFVIVNKNDTINSLIENRVMDIEAIYNELESANKIDDYTKKIIERFLIKIDNKNKFLDEQDNILYKDYKDYKINNIKILLYNNQDKITKDISLFISND
jgi:hypothetical protein